MFSDRLNAIMRALGASSSDLARFAGCDRSNVSRMCSGARVPRREGESLQRLTRGIFAYADAVGRTAVLCSVLDCQDAISAGDISFRLAAWLFEEEGGDVSGLEDEDSAPFGRFGERLSALMQLSGLSNVQLGKLINVDASYMSRFKNGHRSPRSNPGTMELMCRVFLKKFSDTGAAADLASLMRVPTDALEDEDEALSRLKGWLFEEGRGGKDPLVNTMLEGIDSFSGPLRPAGYDSPPRASTFDAVQLYRGCEGLRDAVTRLFVMAASAGRGELLFYCDQDLGWMLDSPGFPDEFRSLLIKAIHSGVRVKAILNMARDTDDIIEGIKVWLPLCMSGVVELFCPTTRISSPVSSALIICPGAGCIHGLNPSGREDSCGAYFFSTDAEAISAGMAVFYGMLAQSARMVKVYRQGEGHPSRKLESSGFTAIRHAPSLATMPADLLKEMLDRCGAESRLREYALSSREVLENVFKSSVSRGFLYEVLPTPDTETLLQGKVPADIPGTGLFYTPSEYARHVENMLSLEREHGSYRIILVPEPSFPNTSIAIGDGLVTVGRLKPPRVTFSVTQRDLCGAFSEFARGLREKYMEERAAVRSRLGEYLKYK